MDMREYGTFNLPMGSWTDDSSLEVIQRIDWIKGLCVEADKQVNVDSQ